MPGRVRTSSYSITDGTVTAWSKAAVATDHALLAVDRTAQGRPIGIGDGQIVAIALSHGLAVLNRWVG